MKLELEKSREQQQMSSSNGYRSETNDMGSGNPLVQSQHRLEYSLSDAVPQTASMHLQAGDEMEEPLDAEDEDEDEEDDDEEEDEEEENEEDEEDEEDSSSVCSGLSDSSTQSLANSDSEDDDEEEEEDEEKSENFEDDMTTPSVSHTEVVPLSSVLCYSEGSVAHDNHVNGNAFLMNSSSAEYYQLGSSSAVSNGQASQSGEPYGEALAFQDSVSSTNNNNVAPGPFNMTTEQYTDYSNQPEEQYTSKRHFTMTNGAPAASFACYSPDKNKALSKVPFVEQPDNQNQTQFQNYLNNNTECSYNSNSSFTTAEQPQKESSVNGHSDLTLLANNTKSLPLSDHCPEVTAI